MPLTWAGRGRWRTALGGAVRLVVSAGVGAATGLVVHGVTLVSGRSLFLVTGGIAGIVTAAVMRVYRRSGRLTEVKVIVPQVSELTFLVNNDSRQAAWQFFVDTVTRISTQPLQDDEGIVREAMNSLYALFQSTRETLKASRPSPRVPGGQSVEHLAVHMLNAELRPFLGRWHPRLRSFEQEHPGEGEASWPDNAECRAELRRLQGNMYEYAVGFARLAGVSDARAMILAEPRTPAEGS
ncbi:hypothetical protein [Sphaerisporangium corydalis]|uniref:SAV-6107-like HEPN domain-containing protein n=1 Tax=Sphaerisporangium corydalis TaxID=1441875 RepID=A0ABV9EBJ8_9ACTN|nr:hypothetical protein [Sphaerisporangium corydalis]